MTSTTTMRWAVRVAVVGAVVTWLTVRQVEDLPTEVTGPGPEDVAAVTVAPSTSGPWPPADAGPWEVYALTEIYRDDEGRTYDPPAVEAMCVPVAELDAEVAEGDLTVWGVPVPWGAYRQGGPCPGSGD